MELPEDVAPFIAIRFAKQDVPEARNLLSAATVEAHGQSPARLIRCAVFAAQGRIDEFRYYAQLMAVDLRDVIVAGEFDFHGEELVQVRDLNGPLRV